MDKPVISLTLNDVIPVLWEGEGSEIYLCKLKRDETLGVIYDAYEKEFTGTPQDIQIFGKFGNWEPIPDLAIEELIATAPNMIMGFKAFTGHAGRPGKIGGALPKGASAPRVIGPEERARLDRVNAGKKAFIAARRDALNKGASEEDARNAGNKAKAEAFRSHDAGTKGTASAATKPAVEPAKPVNPLEKPFADGDLTNKKSLKSAGGVNESYRVDVEGDGRAILKPDTEGIWGRPPNESSVYDTAQMLGFDVVPYTVLRGGGKASLQHWIEGGTSGNEMGMYGSKKGIANEAAKNSASQIFVTDMVTGNHDRHYGNFLQTSDGKLHAIDNGFSFNARRYDVNTSFIKDHFTDMTSTVGLGSNIKSLLNPAHVKAGIALKSNKKFEALVRKTAVDTGKDPDRVWNETVGRITELESYL